MAEKQDYGIVLGIDTYAHLENLKGARADADGFRRWLIAQGVPPGNILPQQLDNDEEYPKYGQLVEPFEELSKRSRRFKDPNFGRRLYVFVAGHGAMKSLYDAHLLAANFQAHGWSAFLPVRQFVERIAVKASFEEIVMFADCCRTKMSLGEPPIPIPDDVDADSQDVQACYGYATGPARKSREQFVADKGHRGLFTLALLEALEGGAANEDGVITPQSIKWYLEWRMEELKASQTPQFYPPQREIVFGEGLSPLRTKVTIGLRKGVNGVTVFDDNLNELNSHDGSSPLSFDLAPGHNYIIAPKGEKLGRSDMIKIKLGREPVNESF